MYVFLHFKNQFSEEHINLPRQKIVGIHPSKAKLVPAKQIVIPIFYSQKSADGTALEHKSIWSV